jgi:hypothetical protein
VGSRRLTAWAMARPIIYHTKMSDPYLFFERTTVRGAAEPRPSVHAWKQLDAVTCGLFYDAKTNAAIALANDHK